MMGMWATSAPQALKDDRFGGVVRGRDGRVVLLVREFVVTAKNDVGGGARFQRSGDHDVEELRIKHGGHLTWDSLTRGAAPSARAHSRRRSRPDRAGALGDLLRAARG